MVNEELLGANHPHLAAQLNNMGILARDLGNFAESERLHRRALAIAEKALGPAHPDVASILNSLARLYGRQGRIEEGIALLERALGDLPRDLRRGARRDRHDHAPPGRLRAPGAAVGARRTSRAGRQGGARRGARRRACTAGRGLDRARPVAPRSRPEESRPTAAFREGVRIGTADVWERRTRTSWRSSRSLHLSRQLQETRADRRPP